MSLREEIYGEIVDYNLVGYKPQILVNQILKLFEKRIDSRIAYYNSLSEFRKNSVRIDELERVKEEMMMVMGESGRVVGGET